MMLATTNHGEDCSSSDPAVQQDEPLPARNEWLGVASAILGSVAILSVMLVPHLRGHSYRMDDLGAFHYPLRAFYSECLGNGQRFDWMPTIFGGFYVSGEGQLGAYHPFHWILYRFFPLRTAFHIELIAPYPFMMAGMYLLLRRCVESREAAIFGAMVFTFSSFNMLHFVHPNAIAVVSHIPWLGFAMHVWAVGAQRSRLFAEAAIPVLTASQLLLGYPQYVWLSLIGEAAWAVFLLRRRWSSYVFVAALKLIGLLLGAIQWIPTWELLRDSDRSQVSLDFLMTGSWFPGELLQVLAPYALKNRALGGNTHELGFYFGAVPLFLVYWLLFRKRLVRKGQNFFRSVEAFLAVALVLAFGKFGGLAILLTGVPLVGSFRVPARAIMLVQFALAILTSLSFRELCRINDEPDRKQVLSLHRDLTIYSIILMMTVAVFSYQGRIGQIISTWPWGAVGPLLIAAGGGLCRAAASRRPWGVSAVVLFTAADLGFYGVTYTILPWEQAPADVPFVWTPPPGQVGDRIVADPRTFGATHGKRMGNYFAEYGFTHVDGYAGLEPRSQLFAGGAPVPALRAAGVRWVCKSAAPAEIKDLMQVSPTWWEVPMPVPRVRLITDAVISAQPSRDINRIDPELTVLVEKPLPMAVGIPGTAALIAEVPGELVIRTEATSPQLLVVADRFNRGWTVFIDNAAGEVLRVNGDFMGCMVPAGVHTVRLEFSPGSLRWGKSISILGACLFLCLLGARFLLASRPKKIDSNDILSHAERGCH